jgi:hypothetical protein
MARIGIDQVDIIYYEKIGINQGDRVYYYDLSTGGVSRTWNFQGGTPNTSTVYGPEIRYYGVNYTGYSTGLVITGPGGITAAAYKPNIIVVYPEIFNPAIVITGGSGSGYGAIGSPGSTSTPDSPMGRTLTYAAGGSASSGYASYNWRIPQLGLTSGTTLSSVSYACTDWYTLTGTYLGAPNSSYVVAVGLKISSTVGNAVSLGRNVNFRKIGVEESVNYRSSGTYATSGKYYNVSTLSQRTSVLGLGGNSLVFKIDFGPYSPRWNNTSFHSTQEAVYIWPNSPDISKTYSPIKTNIILSGSALSSAGMTGGYTASPRIMTGNYIAPSDVSSQFNNRFYMSDNLASNTFTGLVDGLREWNTLAVNDFIENKYYLSGSSKFIELGGYYKTFSGGGRPPFADLASGIGYKNEYLGYLWDGGWAEEDGYADSLDFYHGICIPTSAFIEEAYGQGGVNVDVRIILSDSDGSTITEFESVVSSSGNTGNTPDLYMISACDTEFGNFSGIATLINAGIAARPGGLSDNIIFEVDFNLSPYYNGGAEGIYVYNQFFGGLKMSIKDPLTSSTYSNSYIHSMEIMWGSQMQDFLNDVRRDSGQFPTSKFASDINASGSGMASWTGLPSKITVPSSSHNNYFRGWKIGGSL